MCLTTIVKLIREPGCQQKIRGISSALAWCMEPWHDLEWMSEYGMGPGAYAVQICAGVFGRVRFPRLSSQSSLPFPL